MQLLRPLLLDTVPSIQQSAALALGRLANYSEALAHAVVTNDVLPQLVYNLTEQNRFYKKAAAFVLRAVAKHSAELAQQVADAGALDSLVACLAEFEPAVKEAACYALGHVARHTPELAQAVVDAGAVSQLVLCVQEPELALKRVAASALAEIAKHSPELAHAVVDSGAVTYLAALVRHNDAKLKRQVCAALGQIAKHTVDLASVVVEAEVFPPLLHCLKDADLLVRKNAATCVREIAKHSPELATLIVNQGGHTALIDYAADATVTGADKLPAIMALGYIAAFSETLATAICAHEGILPLKRALVDEKEDHIRAAAAFSLGQIGRHSSDHAKALAEADVLRALVAAFDDPASSEDLKQKTQRALKAILAKCSHAPALEPLFLIASPTILKHLVQQFAKILKTDLEARKSFMLSGCLQKLQSVKADQGSELQEHIAAINACYPPEVIQSFSPNFKETMLKKLEEFKS